MDREQEVWEALRPVTDPELDESVTELGFVRSVEINHHHVKILFHLPTYWCAANFAYMMASDMHEAVRSLPWVADVDVELLEHMYGETINKGIKARQSFQSAFGDEASDDIDAVRQKFRKKAFQQRQELMLRKLLEQGTSKSEMANLKFGALCRYEYPHDEDQRLLQRYIEIRQEFGGHAGVDSFAFVTVEGEKLSEDGIDAYLQELRSTRINTQFNGELCRGLLNARYGTDQSKLGASPIEVKLNFHPKADLHTT